MAKNKITHDYNGKGTGYVFTGSQRQPTLLEIANYCQELNRSFNSDNINGLFICGVGLGNSEWLDPEENKSIEVFSYNGEDPCPVCGKVLDMTMEHCPICGKRWNEE